MYSKFYKSSGVNIFAVDPTRTTQLRKRFVQQFNKRWNKIKKLIVESVVTNDCFGLGDKSSLNSPIFFAQYPISSQEFKFNTDASKISKFLSWLDEMMEQGIFEVKNGQYWFNPFILGGYSRGIEWANSNVKKIKAQMIKAGIVPPLSIDMSILQILEGRYHVAALESLYTRSFQDLKGITAAMDAAISRELADGFLQGESAVKVARRLLDRVEKIGKYRAILFARTEIIRAHHFGTINRYKDLEVKNVKVKAEWMATPDGRVCATCAGNSGKIFTLKEITPLIPIHPQCRCTTIAVFDIND